MQDLLDAQALIQLEADKVVRLLGLDALLSRVGRPTRVGPLMTIESRVDPHERRRRDGTLIRERWTTTPIWVADGSERAAESSRSNPLRTQTAPGFHHTHFENSTLKFLTLLCCAGIADPS